MTYAEPAASSRARTQAPAHGGADEVNGSQLRSYVERVERLNEEKKALNDDLKEVYAEMRGNGFDAKIVKKIVQIRAQDADQRTEEETLIEIYLAALGSN